MAVLEAEGAEPPLPHSVCPALSVRQIGYFMIGLAPVAATFFTHTLVAFILGCVLVSFGNTVAAAMPSFDVAQVRD